MRFVPFIASLVVATAFASGALGAYAATGPGADTPRKPAARPTVAPSPGPDTDGVRFRAIGPAIAGGRVAAVAGSDRDPKLYYVGGAAGGVFKSTDGGDSFASVWEHASRYGAIGAIAVAPSNALGKPRPVIFVHVRPPSRDR